MSKQEVILDYIECKSITTSLSNTSQFSFAKSGHVQILKDWTRRSYVLKLIAKLDSKNPNLGLIVNVSTIISEHFDQPINYLSIHSTDKQN